MRTQLAIVLPLLALAMSSCALDAPAAVETPAVDGHVSFTTPVRLRRLGLGCTDRDGDGFGAFCTAGPDCDDANAAIHTGCSRCLVPSEGCDCAADPPTDMPCAQRLGGDCMQGSLRCVGGTITCGELRPVAEPLGQPGESVRVGARHYAFTGDPCDSCDLTCRNDPRIPGCPGVVPADACTTSATCPGGRTCYRGFCECTTDAQCAAGQFCQGRAADLDQPSTAAPDGIVDGFCVDTSLCTGTADPDETYDRVGWNPMPDGGLRPGITIGEGTTVFSRYAWVANNGQGTVSKVCLEDCPDAWDPNIMHGVGSEVGRYIVGSGPSRTAIDGMGNAYVGNRWDGYLTAFAGDWGQCDPDRNGDVMPCTGTLPARPAGLPPAGSPNDDAYCYLQTSRGGLTGTAHWLSPRDNPLTGNLPRDECVRWHIPVVGGNIARSVAVGPGRPGEGAPGGWAFIGTWSNQRAYKVHPTGCLVNAAGCQADPDWPAGGSIPIGLSSYGAVGFEEGDVWFASLQSTGWSGIESDAAITVPAAGTFNPPAGHYIRSIGWMNAGYGISQDQHHRLWQSGWAEAGPVIYDPGVEAAGAGGYLGALTSGADDSWCHVDVSAIGTPTVNNPNSVLANTRGITGDNVNNFEISDVPGGTVLNTVSAGSQWMSFWYGGATVMVQMRTPAPAEGCPYCNTWREMTVVWYRTLAGTCSLAANVWSPGCFGLGWVERTGTLGTTTRVCANASCSVVIPGSVALVTPRLASFCTNYTAAAGGGPRGYRDWRVWGHGIVVTGGGFTNTVGTSSPLGVGLDPAGNPITINVASNDASIVFPATSAWPTAQAWAIYPTTAPRFSSTYTYSDFTGSLRDMFSDPMGLYTKRYECGPMEVGVWEDLTWDTSVLAGHEIIIFARVGSTIAELTAATAVEIARIPPSPLTGAANIAAALEGTLGAMGSRRRYLEVQFALVRLPGDTTSPVLHDFNLDWHCVPVF